MIDLVNSLIFNREFLAAFGFSLAGVLVLLSFMFGKFSGKIVLRFWFSFVFSLFLNLLTTLVLVFVVSYFAKFQLGQFLTLVFIFTIIYYVNLALSFAVMLGNTLPKAKKTGDFLEAVEDGVQENTSRVINLFVILAILLVVMFVLGNGSINALLVSLLISGLVSSASSVFFFPRFLKLFEKILK